MSFGLEYITKPLKAQIAKLGSELAETKLILNEYMSLHKELRDKIEAIDFIIKLATTDNVKVLGVKEILSTKQTIRDGKDVM